MISTPENRATEPTRSETVARAGSVIFISAGTMRKLLLRRNGKLERERERDLEGLRTAVNVPLYSLARRSMNRALRFLR